MGLAFSLAEAINVAWGAATGGAQATATERLKDWRFRVAVAREVSGRLDGVEGADRALFKRLLRDPDFFAFVANPDDPELRAKVDDGRLERLLDADRSPERLGELGRGLAAAVEVATARAGTPQDQMLYARLRDASDTLLHVLNLLRDSHTELGQVLERVDRENERELRAARRVLIPPYAQAAQLDTASPLQLVRPEFGVVPFQPCDELDVLVDWCLHGKGPSLGVAVLTGSGGAGKTRVAAEVGRRLADRYGWVAGFLPKANRQGVGSPRGTERRARALEWLAECQSPVLAIVDYAEARGAEAIELAEVLADREDRPTRVVLTARGDGPWRTDLDAALFERGLRGVEEQLALPRLHQDPARLFRAALTRFSEVFGREAGPATRATGGRWTTLDLVLIAWLSVREGKEPPDTPEALYDEVLEHELRYWRDTYRERHVDVPVRRAFDEAGALVHLTRPATARVEPVLRSVELLVRDDQPRSWMAETLAICLGDRDEAVSVQPDRVGDRLALRTLEAGGDLLDRAVGAATDTERAALAQTLARAALDWPDTARQLVLRAGRWTDAPDEQDRSSMAAHGLAVAASVGGVWADALAQLAEEGELPLALDELAAAIPLGHAHLRRLALVLARALLDQLPSGTDPDTVKERARLLNNLSNRQAELGDHRAAMDTITEAIGIRRQLAETNPDAFVPDLAASLNNLSNHQAALGDGERALATITEATEIGRQLVEGNPGAFVADLAASLLNLSNRQADVGDREGALVTITEATGHYRQLAEGNPGAFLPELATSLINLSNQQAELGDRRGALVTITEATERYRQLVETNPGAFLAGLAVSLVNLSVRQAEVGDREGALVTITEATGHYRQLAEGNPGAFLAELATSLNNLSVQQAALGDREGALATITEATEIHRQLVEGNQGAFVADLAASLVNLSNCQAEVGDREGALVTITEATGYYRQLAEANPGAFLHRLAGSLNNLSVRQGELGDREGALTTITEATKIRRRLTEADPGAFLADLAESLTNLALQQAEVGNREGALVTITEATGRYRQLAEANPGAFLHKLATSLNNLSVHQAESGDREGALVTSMEATGRYRRLAEGNPGAFLGDLARSLNNLSNCQRRWVIARGL